MLMNVKMPTIVCIYIFMSMLNTTYESLEARKIFVFKHLAVIIDNIKQIQENFKLSFEHLGKYYGK